MADRLSIDKLRYNFDQGARANRFTVDFFCEKLFPGASFEGLRCINASLPGRQLETADWSEYGPTRKLPFNLSHDGQEVSFTFLCDSTFADRFVIEAWQASVFAGGDSGTSINPQFAYYNDYIGEIQIKTITNSDKDSLVYKLYEAYPVAFAQQELNAESGDIMRFECTFAFRTYTTTYISKDDTEVGAINKGRRLLDIINDIRNLRRGGNTANDSQQRFQDRLARLAGILG